MWKNLVEQLRERLYYFIQFISGNVLEEYTSDKIEFLQPEIFQFNDYMMNKIGGIAFYLELITFMKENGINEDFFNKIKEIPEDKIPNWIKEDVKNFLSLSDFSESELIDVLETIVDLYNYL